MDYKELLLIEAKLKEAISQTICDIANQVKTQSDRITQISTSPDCFTIRFSDLSTKSLYPEYYSSVRQAGVIEEYLKGTSSVSSLANKLNKLIETGYVVIKSTRYPINEATMKVLQKVTSELFE